MTGALRPVQLPRELLAVATNQRLVGHANVTTAVGYDRQLEECKRVAAELLVVAYRQPW